MRTLFASIAGLILGYVLAALIGYAAIMQLSSNVHDKAVEAATTAAFVVGPIGALLGLISTWLFARRRRP